MKTKWCNRIAVTITRKWTWYPLRLLVHPFALGLFLLALPVRLVFASWELFKEVWEIAEDIWS